MKCPSVAASTKNSKEIQLLLLLLLSSVDVADLREEATVFPFSSQWTALRVVVVAVVVDVDCVDYVDLQFDFLCCRFLRGVFAIANLDSTPIVAVVEANFSTC